MDLMAARRRLIEMQEAINNMRLVKQYTVQESWENTTLGVVYVEVETLMADLIQNSSLENLWVAVYENNNAQSYKADYMAVAGKNGNYQVVSSVRDDRTDRGAGGSRSFYASIGTVIKIYQLYN